VMIDSGAYGNMKRSRSAVVSGAEFNRIGLEEYIDFAQAIEGQVWDYVMLDEIKHPQVSLENFRVMRDRGLDPMFVFVEGMTYESIADHVGDRHWFCVAGGGAKLTYLEKRYQMASMWAPNAGLHALGYTRPPQLFSLPIKSCDSSSFTSGSRWGLATVYDRLSGFSSVRVRNINKNPRSTRLFFSLLKRMNVDPDVVFSGQLDTLNHSVFALMTLVSYLDFHIHCVENGVKFFWAIHNFNWIQNLMAILLYFDDFDYPKASEAVLEIGRLWKSDKEAGIARCVEIMAAHTEKGVDHETG